MECKPIDEAVLPILKARLEEKVQWVGDCLEWTGNLNQMSYGRIWIGQRTSYRAHRAAYAVAHGGIPDGMVIDHLCRNPKCCNPDHLEAVPPRENVRRGVGASAKNARKTHCVNGHPYGGEDTFMEGSRRKCRICERARSAKRVAIRRAERAEARNIHNV